jgi:hypothetical protein
VIRGPGSDASEDALERWARQRAPALIARAEAEAAAVLRDALVAASLSEAGARGETSRPATPFAPKAAPAPPPADTRPLVWTYCVLRARDPDPVGVPGVAEVGVERIEAEGLAALVSRVPAGDFAAEPLARNLNDLTWLERVARGHEAVLDAALSQSTIVPLRMCTIFENDGGVRDMLEQQRDSLGDALTALDGRLEWAVKLLVDRERLVEAARTYDAENETASGEGGAYLQRRRAERGAREAASRLATDTAQQVHARLQDWAIDARTRPPQNRELSGHAGEMVLNAAYLVERERTDELRQIVTELEEHHRELGVRIELTGPWPPYNFVPGPDTAALA